MEAFNAVKKNVGSLPIYPKPNDEEEEIKTEEKKDTGPKVITKTVVLPDGSYGTQTVVVDDEVKSKTASLDECSYLPLRNALVNSDDGYLASCLAVTLTKLTIKAKRNLSLTFK